MAALSRQLRIYAFGAAALMRLNVRLWQILLQKSFCTADQKFSRL
jgi:hypothetical protein